MAIMISVLSTQQGKQFSSRGNRFAAVVQARSTTVARSNRSLMLQWGSDSERRAEVGGIGS
jgi:hypothetical protein